MLTKSIFKHSVQISFLSKQYLGIIIFSKISIGFDLSIPQFSGCSNYADASSFIFDENRKQINLELILNINAPHYRRTEPTSPILAHKESIFVDYTLNTNTVDWRGPPSA